jgi:DNA integrity scanning protein DisA with diadenylate cyclase activity
MRVIKEVIKGPLRISIFSWNNKYIVKLETSGMEQTFKLDELQLDSENQLELLMTDKFLQEALERFESMSISVRSALESGN